MKKLKYIYGLFFMGLAVLGMPVSFVEADEKTLGDLIGTVEGLLSSIFPLILSLAVIYFLWALAKYMLKAGEEQAAARDQMIWGIIILFVMVSVWGLVNILSATIFG